MAFIRTDEDVKLYVKDWGEGRPVILIHGWPLSADSWESQALPIAQAGYRVIAYDRRGFGRSDQPWDGYDYDTLSDDLAAVIRETGAKEATIVGFSMGGGEVARYMSRHNGKEVIKAGLISSVVPYMLKTDDNPDGTEQKVFDEIAEQIKEDRAKFFATFFRSFYGVGFASHPVSDEVVDWSWNVAMQASLKATLACAASFATTDFRPDLSSFNIPTLIVHGTEDRTVPIDASARSAAAGISQSELIEYEGAAHGILATNKKQVTDDLIRFLAS